MLIAWLWFTALLSHSYRHYPASPHQQEGYGWAPDAPSSQDQLIPTYMEGNMLGQALAFARFPLCWNIWVSNYPHSLFQLLGPYPNAHLHGSACFSSGSIWGMPFADRGEMLIPCVLLDARCSDCPMENNPGNPPHVPHRYRPQGVYGGIYDPCFFPWEECKASSRVHCAASSSG